jgi:uncharacterized membrane protein YphA (DoxX/SURF4 family)
MNPTSAAVARPGSRLQQGATLTARWILGALFVYLGMKKVFEPVGFLKVLREYQLTDNYLLLNFVASVLPWFEVFCGLLLLTGVAVRGTALLSMAMLIPFTGIILNRALSVYHQGDLAFCAIKFDCGCGAGVVPICGKLLENGFLVLLSSVLVVFRSRLWCLRPAFLKEPCPVP